MSAASDAMAARDRCSNGHLFEGGNVRFYRGARVCRTCKRERSREQWQKDRVRRGGMTRAQLADKLRKHRQTWLAFPPLTAEERKARDRDVARRALERARYLVNAIKGRPCTDCGGTFHPCAMDFDHLDATTKRMTISEMVAKRTGKRAILAEIAKCEVVCSNCHRVRTYERARVQR